jgi:hypothetical protein
MSLRSIVLSLSVLVPVLATNSVCAADGSWDGGAVVVDATIDSGPFDVATSGPDVSLGQPGLDAISDGSGADVRIGSDVRGVDVAAVVPDSALAIDAAADVAQVPDVGYAIDTSAALDASTRGVDGGVDSGPKPILLGDGAAKNLVPDDRGCSVGRFGSHRRSSGFLALLPFLGWAVIRSVRRRGRS